uniref:Uncharacterized protein n=1 Tax=Micrurus surinamensis TaxID=129470 RepID=A0A2D4PM57_MICSU
MYWHRFLSASTLSVRISMTRCTSSLRNEQGQAQVALGYLPAGYELLVATHWLWWLEGETMGLASELLGKERSPCSAFTWQSSGNWECGRCGGRVWHNLLRGMEDAIFLNEM